MAHDDDTVQGSWHFPPLSQRDLRLRVAREAMRIHDFQRAVVEVEELLDDEPDDIDALMMLAACCMELRDWSVARDAWETLREAGRDHASTWTQIAVCAFELCDLEGARHAAQQAVDRDEDAGEAWMLLGETQAREGREAEAQASFERAHLCSPLLHPLPLRMETADAREALEQALREVPEDVSTFWSTVPVRFEAFPDPADLASTVPPITPRAVALYEGEPPPRPSARSRPRALRVYVGNLGHHDSWDTAVAALADALEAECADWRNPTPPDEP